MLCIRIDQLNLGSFKCQPQDKIRINVTTFPTNAKSEYIVEAKDALNVKHVWTFDNQLNKIQRVLVTVRKKSFFEGDPIIGKFAINLKGVPINKIVPMILDMGSKEKRLTPSKVRFVMHNDLDGSVPFEGETSLIY